VRANPTRSNPDSPFIGVQWIRRFWASRRPHGNQELVLRSEKGNAILTFVSPSLATYKEEEGNNTMKIQILGCDFVYHGTILGDPDPTLSIEEVRSFYANEFPELTTAAITGPETVGDRLRYASSGP
jgi:PRTRC genetic system protein C